MDDTSDTPIHRIAIRVAVPPTVSAVLPLADVKRLLEETGFVVIGLSATREDDSTESDPSTLP
jgi:hypothetical protein